MRTTILPPSLLKIVKSNRTLYRAARKVRFAGGSAIGGRKVPGLAQRVHANDFMLTSTSPSDVESYEWGARNVVACIDRSLTAAGRTFSDVESWLDFGSGYGRVIRFLVEKVNPGRVHAADVIAEAAAFSATEFSVWGTQSSEDIASLRLGDSFDFVYAISVLTHLDEDGAAAFLRFMGDSLRPGGIAMFTAHGVARLGDIPEFFGERYRDHQAEIIRSFEATGWAYVPYGYYSDDSYGLSWCSEEYVRAKMQELHGSRLECVLFEPAGLEPGKHDVFAFRRLAE